MGRAFAWIVAAYVAAGAAGVAAAWMLAVDHPIAIVAVADLVATVVVFAFSVAFRNSSFYDAYWSVAPIAIALYWAAVGSAAVRARQMLVVALVIAWGVRLTANWARGWRGLAHEDWRYVQLQRQTGRAYWLVSFLGIHLMPTVWVFLGCLPLYQSLVLGTRPLGWFDAVATVVTGGAIWIEARADAELRAFRAASPSGTVLANGLWAWSRHPNYFGEMSFWWGLWLFGMAADPGWWFTIAGALSITLMFVFVSLPMMETRMLERRPAFAAHRARTSMVIPWFPSR